jgi:hypothetical protein
VNRVFDSARIVVALQSGFGARFFRAGGDPVEGIYCGCARQAHSVSPIFTWQIAGRRGLRFSGVTSTSGWAVLRGIPACRERCAGKRLPPSG